MTKETKELKKEVTTLTNNYNDLIFYAILGIVVLVGLFFYRNMVIYSVRGDMDVDNGTLYVDAAGNKVGVVNKTPSFPVDVMGDINTSTKIREGGFVLIPSGFIAMWTGSVAPNGWTLCDGTNGTPDLRGRFVLSMGQGVGLTNRVLGATGGEETHLLTSAEMPTHTHTGTTAVDGSHTHTVSNTVQKTGSNTPAGLDASANEIDTIDTTSTTTSTAGSHTHTFTTDSTGGGSAHNNMPPFYVLAYIMKL